MKKVIAAVAALTIFGAACTTDAEVAEKNLNKAADQFELTRRIVFINGITDEYLLLIEGKCAVFDQVNQVEVLCKNPDGSLYNHLMGLSDNVTYVVEHLEPAQVSTSRYRVVIKPATLIPDIDLED